MTFGTPSPNHTDMFQNNTVTLFGSGSSRIKYEAKETSHVTICYTAVYMAQVRSRCRLLHDSLVNKNHEICLLLSKMYLLSCDQFRGSRAKPRDTKYLVPVRVESSLILTVSRLAELMLRCCRRSQQE